MGTQNGVVYMCRCWLQWVLDAYFWANFIKSLLSEEQVTTVTPTKMMSSQMSESLVARSRLDAARGSRLV